MSIFSSISGVGSQMLFAMNGVSAIRLNSLGEESDIIVVPATEEIENAVIQIGEEQIVTRTCIIKKAEMEGAVLKVDKISYDGKSSTVDRLSESQGGTYLVTLTRRIQVEKSRPNYRGGR